MNKWLTACMLLLIWIGSAPHVFAAGNEIDHPFLPKSITLNPNDEKAKTVTIQVPFFAHSRLIAPPQLKIDYEVSKLNDAQTGVTVFVDDQPVYTLVASAAKLGGNTSASVVIPLKHIDMKKRMHTVRFVAGTGRKVNGCERSYAHEWITIKNTSRLHLTYEDRAVAPVTLTHFPWSLQLPEKEPLVVVYPTKRTADDDTLFIQTISFLVRKLNLVPGDVKVMTEAEFYERPFGKNVLFVGLFHHFQETTRRLFADVVYGLVPQESALAVVRSPFNANQYMYMLTAADRAGGQYMNKQLSRQAVLQALDGRVMRVKGDGMPPKDNAVAPVKGVVKISDIGFAEGIVAKNVEGTTTLTLPFNVQPGLQLQDGSRAVVHYSYNDTFDETRSTLTASVNGIPVSTVMLKKGEGEKASISVKIPVTELDKERIVVELTFSFKEKEEYECGWGGRTDGWVRILPSSYFELSFENRELTNLKYFPYPLIEAFRWNDVQFVLPNGAPSSYYEQMVNIVCMFSNVLKKDDTSVSLVQRSELKAEKKNYVFYDMALYEKDELPNDIKENMIVTGEREALGQEGVKLQLVPSREVNQFFMFVHATDGALLRRSHELFRIDEWRRAMRNAFGQANIRAPFQSFTYTSGGEYVVHVQSAAANAPVTSAETKNTSIVSRLWNEKVLRMIMQMLLIISTIALIVRIWFDRKKDE